MHLGDFGAAVAELDPAADKDTFSFFGEKFEVVADIPAVLALQMGATMTGKVDDTEGMSAVWSSLEASLGEQEFARFYRLALAKKANIQSLTELAMSLFQASGGERPTAQVPDSPSGQSTTSPSSSTSASTPPVFGEVVEVHDDRDPSVPHLVPVSQVLAG